MLLQMALFHSFYGRVIFHCIYVLHLLYPFICRWASRLRTRQICVRCSSAPFSPVTCVGVSQSSNSDYQGKPRRREVGNDCQGVQPLLVGHSGLKRRHRGGSPLIGHLVCLYVLSCRESSPFSSSSRFSLERLLNFFKEYLVDFDSPGHYFVHVYNGLNGGPKKIRLSPNPWSLWKSLIWKKGLCRCN